MVWRVLGVLALVALAGGGTTVERATLTPAPVPTATPTPEDPAPDVAPGLSATGVADTDTLVEAHVAAARGTTWV